MPRRDLVRIVLVGDGEYSGVVLDWTVESCQSLAWVWLGGERCAVTGDESVAAGHCGPRTHRRAPSVWLLEFGFTRPEEARVAAISVSLANSRWSRKEQYHHFADQGVVRP